MVTKIVLFQHWVGNSVEVHLDKGLEQLDPTALAPIGDLATQDAMRAS